MSGNINPDWIDPGGRSEGMEEIRDREAMEIALQDEAIMGDIPMDEAREDTEDLKDTGGSSAPDNPVVKSEGNNQDLGETENKLTTRKDANDPEGKEDTAKMTTQRAPSHSNNISEDPTETPGNIAKYVHTTGARNNKRAQTQSVPKRNKEELFDGNSGGSQSRSRKAVQICGLLSFQGFNENGRQLTPVETYKASTGMPVENLPKYVSSRNSVEIKTGGMACYTVTSSPLEKPSLVQKTDTLMGQTKASLHSSDTKAAIANEQDTKSAGDTSEDDWQLSDGDFSTGSSSSNSLGDIEGIIAKMSPQTRLVARPLKATQSLPSSKPAQKRNQREMSKSKIALSPSYSRHHRVKKLNNEMVCGRKQRDTRSESNIDSKSAPTVSDSPSPGTSPGNPERHDINGIGLAKNGVTTPAERSTSVHNGESDPGEELSDGDFSTGSSGSSSFGDIEDICDKMSRPSTQLVDHEVNSTQSPHSPQIEQKDSNQELGHTKSDTPKCRGEQKSNEDALNQKEEGNQRELGEPTDQAPEDELKPTVGGTATPDEQTKDTEQEASQQSCLRRNPRFARKRYRATTPVKSKPRKRLVNFASFENIRLFSSAKHLLVTSSLVGKSRVRVKKGVITPEEKAIREEEIRDQTKMDSDEKMERQMNKRMGLFKASLSDSDLEEQIDTGYYQEDESAKSLEQSFFENSTPVRVQEHLGMDEGAITPEEKNLRDQEPTSQAKMDSDEKMDQPMNQKMELMTDYLSHSEPDVEIDTGYYQKEEPATSEGHTSCENDTTDVEDGESSLYPDFNAITPGDMDALTRATDALFEMMDEPCHQGAQIANKQMSDTKTEEQSIDKAEDQAIDPSLGSCSDDSDTSSTASILAESISPEELPARRTRKLTRFIRSVGHVIMRGIAKTRRLTRACCVQQATG